MFKRTFARIWILSRHDPDCCVETCVTAAYTKRDKMSKLVSFVMAKDDIFVGIYS